MFLRSISPTPPDDEQKAQEGLVAHPAADAAAAAAASPTLVEDGSSEDEGFLTIPTLTDADVEQVLAGQVDPPGFPPLSFDEEELGDIVSRRRAAAGENATQALSGRGTYLFISSYSVVVLTNSAGCIPTCSLNLSVNLYET